MKDVGWKVFQTSWEVRFIELPFGSGFLISSVTHVNRGEVVAIDTIYLINFLNLRATFELSRLSALAHNTSSLFIISNMHSTPSSERRVNIWSYVIQCVNSFYREICLLFYFASMMMSASLPLSKAKCLPLRMLFVWRHTMSSNPNYYSKLARASVRFNHPPVKRVWRFTREFRSIRS